MFVVSKLAVLPLSPLNLLLLALLLALVLLRTRKAIWGRRIVGGCAAILLALAVLPWEGWLLVPLRNVFRGPDCLTMWTVSLFWVVGRNR